MSSTSGVSGYRLGLSAMTRWHHSLLFSLGAATFIIAHPLFAFAYRNGPGGTYSTAPGLLSMILVYQILPMVGFFAVDRLLCWKGPRWLVDFYRAGLFSAALWLFFHLGRMLASEVGFLSTAIGATVFYWLSFRLARRHLLRGLLALSVLSPVCSAVFVQQTGLIGKAWAAPQLPIVERNTSKAPIFILVFDALGKDILFNGEQLDSERFPNIGALGGDSLVFTNAMTNFGTTEFSIPTMLQGQKARVPEYWEQRTHGLPGLGKGGLLRHYQNEGYRVAAFSAVYGCDQAPVCVTGEHMVRRYPLKAPQELANFFAVHALLPKAWMSNGYWTPFPIHTYATVLWQAFVDDVRVNGAGSAYFVHSMFPHHPYGYDATGFTGTVSFAGISTLEQHKAMYEKQVQYVDQLVGGLLDALKETGLYETSTIVLTADHGPVDIEDMVLGLDPEEPFGIGARIPLIVHSPKFDPGYTDIPYQHANLKDLLLTRTFTPSGRTYTRVFIGEGGKLKAYYYAERDGRWMLAE